MKLQSHKNDVFTDWFSVINGVKHADSLLPTILELFINDLVNEFDSLGYWIQVGTYKIDDLLYADDIVILAENEKILLDKLYAWCSNGSWKSTNL